MAFGTRIREVYKQRLGLTQERFVETMQLRHLKSREALSNYNRGVSEPDLNTLEEMADTLCLSLDYLREREPAPGWSPALRTARQKLLRDLAQHDQFGDTPTERIVRLLPLLHKRMPQVNGGLTPSEAVFAAWLRWSVGDWERAKLGTSMATTVQIAAAAEFLDLPTQWFLDGKGARLQSVAVERLLPLAELLYRSGKDVPELERLLSQT